MVAWSILFRVVLCFGLLFSSRERDDLGEKDEIRCICTALVRLAPRSNRVNADVTWVLPCPPDRDALFFSFLFFPMLRSFPCIGLPAQCRPTQSCMLLVGFLEGSIDPFSHT